MKTIYLRTNNINGMKYVGQTSDLKRRERDWRKIGTNYSNKQLNEDRQKYGLDAWDVAILGEYEDSYADEMERKFIEEYNTLYPNGYNRYSGGIRDFTFEMENETKQKISDKIKGIPKPDGFGEKISKVRINNPKISKQVFQYTLDRILVAIYPSTREAARQTGFSQGNIEVCCKGGFYSKRRNKWINRLQYKGYIWSYEPL